MLKTTDADHARFVAQADQMRFEGLHPPLARIVVAGPDGWPEVLDEIVQVITAPPGWSILDTQILTPDDAVEDLLTDPILGWSVGRRKCWPFTCEQSAEDLATQRFAVVRPDGAVIDEDGQYFCTLDNWLVETKAELRRRKAA